MSLLAFMLCSCYWLQSANICSNFIYYITLYSKATLSSEGDENLFAYFYYYKKLTIHLWPVNSFLKIIVHLHTLTVINTIA